MSVKVKATYTQGVFVPLPGEALRELPDEAEVELTVQHTPADASNSPQAIERLALLREIAASMKANSFSGDPPPITREELHERR
jgi:hypothetical protein